MGIIVLFIITSEVWPLTIDDNILMWLEKKVKQFKHIYTKKKKKKETKKKKRYKNQRQ